MVARSCVNDEITGDGFPENERIFLENLTRTRLTAYSTPRSSFPRWLAARRAHSVQEISWSFFIWLDKGEGLWHRWKKRKKARVRRRNAKGKILACTLLVRSNECVVRRSYFFYSLSLSLSLSLPLLCPTLSKELARSFKVAAWLFVPAATQTQFAFRPLSFLHDTLRTWHLVCVCITGCVSFFSSGRSVNPDFRQCHSALRPSTSCIYNQLGFPRHDICFENDFIW